MRVQNRDGVQCTERMLPVSHEHIQRGKPNPFLDTVAKIKFLLGMCCRDLCCYGAVGLCIVSQWEIS